MSLTEWLNDVFRCRCSAIVNEVNASCHDMTMLFMHRNAMSHLKGGQPVSIKCNMNVALLTFPLVSTKIWVFWLCHGSKRTNHFFAWVSISTKFTHQFKQISPYECGKMPTDWYCSVDCLPNKVKRTCKQTRMQGNGYHAIADCFLCQSSPCHRHAMQLLLLGIYGVIIDGLRRSEGGLRRSDSMVYRCMSFKVDALNVKKRTTRYLCKQFELNEFSKMFSWYAHATFRIRK